MLKLHSSKQFRKDFKKASKSGKNMSLLYEVITLLQRQVPLPPKFKDHELKGKWYGCRDCHIQPDWLLIYKVNKTNGSLELLLLATGSHSYIFGK